MFFKAAACCEFVLPFCYGSSCVCIQKFQFKENNFGQKKWKERRDKGREGGRKEEIEKGKEQRQNAVAVCRHSTENFSLI